MVTLLQHKVKIRFYNDLLLVIMFHLQNKPFNLPPMSQDMHNSVFE